jgi:hypothetical protein
MGEPDCVNTLIYTIIKHFIGAPSNITARISDVLKNLRCPTMSDYRWYQDVFHSRVMLKLDSQKPYWKEKCMTYFILQYVQGLVPSLELVCPTAEHRTCVQHLYVNFKIAGHQRILLKDMIWNTTSSYT